MSFARATWISLALVGLSWLWVTLGVYAGRTWDSVPHGGGQDLRSGISRDLFRFDAEYYFAIAESGYAYNGDPHSSPNIVFAPAFPMGVRGLAHLGINTLDAGFWLNRFGLLITAFLLLQLLGAERGPLGAALLVLAVFTSAGSYSLHAYYSESLMLMFLSMLLVYLKKNNPWGAGLATAALGATRVTALPMVIVVAVFCLYQAKKSWHKDKPRSLPWLLSAALCPSWLLAYWLFLAFHFGNPLRLMPEIQAASWGFFHPPIDWLGLASGYTPLKHWWAALQTGSWADIKTLNLLWTTLAAVAAFRLFLWRRYQVESWLFIAYFLFIYFTNSTSDFLISAHRFFLLMLPVFFMFAELNDYLQKKYPPAIAYTVTGLFLSLNMFYGLLHTAYFNNGVWYYF